MLTAPFLIAGVDEVGRGPLAGPVTAAAVVLDPRRPVDGLNDSKALDEPTRIRLARAIRQRAIGVALGEASVEEIDRLNILQASLLAMRRAIQALLNEGIGPRLVLIDGNQLAGSDLPEATVIKGDGRVASIAAASIVAKVSRDALMDDWHERLPQYGFGSHKGYGTAAHRAAIREHGVTELHRRSFAPIRQALQDRRREASGPVPSQAPDLPSQGQGTATATATAGTP